MSGHATASSVVRRAGDGSHRWFFGGGEWTWKASSADGVQLSVVEIELEQGKCTPLHTHPIEEALWVLEGQLRYRIASEDVDLDVGDFVLVPQKIPHAFLVTSAQARVLSIMPSHECEAFYLGASEPAQGSARETDFAKIAQSGTENGGITILGPPPF